MVLHAFQKAYVAMHNPSASTLLNDDEFLYNIYQSHILKIDSGNGQNYDPSDPDVAREIKKFSKQKSILQWYRELSKQISPKHRLPPYLLQHLSIHGIDDSSSGSGGSGGSEVDVYDSSGGSRGEVGGRGGGLSLYSDGERLLVIEEEEDESDSTQRGRERGNARNRVNVVNSFDQHTINNDQNYDEYDDYIFISPEIDAIISILVCILLFALIVWRTFNEAQRRRVLSEIGMLAQAPTTGMCIYYSVHDIVCVVYTCTYILI